MNTHAALKSSGHDKIKAFDLLSYNRIKKKNAFTSAFDGQKLLQTAEKQLNYSSMKCVKSVSSFKNQILHK